MLQNRNPKSGCAIANLLLFQHMVARASGTQMDSFHFHESGSFPSIAASTAHEEPVSDLAIFVVPQADDACQEDIGGEMYPWNATANPGLSLPLIYTATANLIGQDQSGVECIPVVPDWYDAKLVMDPSGTGTQPTEPYFGLVEDLAHGYVRTGGGQVTPLRPQFDHFEAGSLDASYQDDAEVAATSRLVATQVVGSPRCRRRPFLTPDCQESLMTSTWNGYRTLEDWSSPSALGTVSQGPLSSIMTLSSRPFLVGNVVSDSSGDGILSPTGAMTQAQFEITTGSSFMPMSSTESLASNAEFKDPDFRSRSHVLYRALAGEDGSYYCPFTSQTDCNHQPTRLKCIYDKYIDSHVKPFRCKDEKCREAEFSSTACLLRHEREAHGLHGHGSRPFVCHYSKCARAQEENGFPRHWNLLDHMRRMHAHGESQAFPSTTMALPSGKDTGRRAKKAHKRRSLHNARTMIAHSIRSGTSTAMPDPSQLPTKAPARMTPQRPRRSLATRKTEQREHAQQPRGP